MKEPRRSRWELWLVVMAGSSLMLLTGAGAYWVKSNAERQRLTLEMATDDNALLLPPAQAFAANDAVGDLIESLPPDLAREVCANLTGDLARMAKRPCDELREIAAVAPAASPVPLGDAMAAMPADVVTPPQLPAGPVSVPEAAPPPQPAPIQTTFAHSEPLPDPTVTQVAAAPGPVSAVILGAIAAAGAPIASAQTTEQPAPVSANGEGEIYVTVLVEGTEPPPPTQAAPGDTMDYWLFLSGMPEGDSADTDGLGEDATAEEDASVAAATAAAKAQAKAAAEAQAKAKASAAARAKALAATLGSDKDSGSTANAGKGKDRDQGAGSSGSNADSSGGGNND
jgi:hypothetical protein